VIRGTADDGDARSALADAVPESYDDPVCKGREVSPVFVDIGNPAGSVWDGVVRYDRDRAALTDYLV
jgi:hypothetical protein